MNCKPGELAIVVRNTGGDPCTQLDQGRVIVTGRSWGYSPALGVVWMLPRSETCPHCLQSRIGYLDNDLLPIRGKPKRDTAPPAEMLRSQERTAL